VADAYFLALALEKVSGTAEAFSHPFVIRPMKVVPDTLSPSRDADLGSVA
jgi:hypothetical protein